jgi:hypothetical protein
MEGSSSNVPRVPETRSRTGAISTEKQSKKVRKNVMETRAEKDASSLGKKNSGHTSKKGEVAKEVNKTMEIENLTEEYETIEDNTKEQQTVQVVISKGKEKVTDNEERGEEEFNKERNDEQQEGIDDDNMSEKSMGSSNSDFPEWRSQLNLKRYVARAKAALFIGKNYGQKLSEIAKELENKINYTFAKIDYRKKTKGSYITLFFNNKEEWKKALDYEFSSENKENFKLEGKPLNTNKNSKKIQEKRVVIWDIPISVKKQELSAEIERKFGKIDTISMYVGGMWQKAFVTFHDIENARNFLKEWAQIIGEDVVRVTPPGVSPENLKLRGKYAVKAVGIPQGMTPAELYNGLNNVGIKTCYVPRNSFYSRKRIAILSVESEEIVNNIKGHIWETDDFNIRLVGMDEKTCFRCHDTNHLVRNCPVNAERDERNLRLKKNMEKFGEMWKKNNRFAYDRINKRLDPAYSAVVKTSNNRNSLNRSNLNQHQETEVMNDIMNKLEQMQKVMDRNTRMLTNVINRLEKVEDILEVPNDEAEIMSTTSYESETEEQAKDKWEKTNNTRNEKRQTGQLNETNPEIMNQQMLEVLNKLFGQQEQMNKQIEQVMQRQDTIESSVVSKRV